MTAKLELRGITKIYGKKPVAQDVNLSVDTGEFFVILGPSGEGKSTFLRIVAGLETPDAGRVLIEGEDVTDLPPNRRNVAMVFQNYALYPNLNVYKNIAFPLKMQLFPREEIEPKVREVARTLGITDILSSRVDRISGGQQQRVALARAIVRHPKLFLLDEPLSNLDARVRFSARAELKKIQRELGQTFVYVTHDQKEAETLSDRTGVIHSGRFEQISTFRELHDRPDTRWVGDFVGDVPMNYLPRPDPAEGEEIGFRPEWARVGEGPYRATVEVSERSGDITLLLCTSPEGRRVFLRSLRDITAGETVPYAIERALAFDREGRRRGTSATELATTVPSGTAP